VFAFLGLGIEIVNELVAQSNHANTNTFLNVLTASLVVAALGFGAYAQTSQMRRWSRQTRQRNLIGLPVALLTLVSVVPNFYEKPALGAMHRDVSHTPTAPASSAPTQETDNALVKPGWYGEIQQDGLLLIVSSYEEKAFESKQFNSRLFKPVSYATLTVINLGCSRPVVLNSFQIKAHLSTGEVVQSLPLGPLLSQNAQHNSDLTKRLALPQTLAIGGMLPDIPVCMEPGFSWARVNAVTVAPGPHEIVIPGRLMTAEEKKSLLSKNTARHPISEDKGAAESWFKGL